MNITSQVSTFPLATVVNPPTDNLRRDNNLRELTPPPAATSQSAAEKGVASNKDNAKTPAQNNEQNDFSALKKQNETSNSSVNDQQSRQGSNTAGQNENQQGNNSANQNENQQNNNSQNKAQAEQNTSNTAQGDTQEASETEALAIEQQIASLKKRDLEVKAHESAHASVGGSVTGAPSFSFKRGPDGKNYAVDGEVSVDISKVSGDPQATIAKMQKVYAAALAPQNPSAQDKQVAAQAAKNTAQAQSEILNVNLEQSSGSSKSQAPQARTSQRLKAEDQSTFKQDNSDDFDTVMNRTLKAQEDISPTRSDEINQRALRIASFYSNINQAYEKAPSFQFQLTA
jgi:SprA family protein